MTAPLFFVEPVRLDAAGSGHIVLLDGPEGRHAATVKRLLPGEPILLADGNGRVAEGTVEQVHKDALTVRVDIVRTEVPALPRITLVQALAKADRDDQAIEAATELGVDCIVPWQAERSIVQWKGERGQKAARKWEQLLRAAAKQSRRATVPVLEPLLDRKQFAQRLSDRHVLVLHEDADLTLASALRSAPGDAAEIALIVGPEGGISPSELDALSALGATAVRLGPHVLRSSSAGPAAVAIVMADLRWADGGE